MKLVKLTLMAIVIAFATTSCSKQIDTPAAYPSSEQMTAADMPQEDGAAVAAAPAAATATASTLSMIQTPVSYNVDDHIKGFLQALPSNYSSTTGKYPLIIFCHGIGEKGNGTTDLAKVANNSVPNLIQNKKFPATFNVGGKDFSFIVISPQFNNWPAAKHVNDMVNYAVAHYRVDTSRIYVVGLSMGGGNTWDYGSNFTKRVAAIVPMCGATASKAVTAQSIAVNGLGVWAFHNSSDPTVSVQKTEGWIKTINSYSPVVAPRKTIFAASGHNCWTKASDPNYKETINGVSMNIYQWLLTFKR